MITDYVEAVSVEEAVALSREGYTFLAGGTQVNNAAFATRGSAADKVVSLGSLDLGGIVAADDGWTIGAGVTLQELADAHGPSVPAALRTAAGFVPTRNVRNIATIGGNIGANRRDSYIIPALIALRGEVEIAGSERLSVEEYITDERGDLILRIHVPSEIGISTAVKESRSHLALPVVSAAVCIGFESATISTAIVAAGCLSRRVVRLHDVESALLAGGRPRGAHSLEEAIADAISPSSDVLGSAEYKRYINSVVIADAIRHCLKGAE